MKLKKKKKINMTACKKYRAPLLGAPKTSPIHSVDARQSDIKKEREMRPTVSCLHKRYFFSTVVVMLLGLLIELAKIDVIIFSGPEVMRSVFTKKLTFGSE